MKYLFWIVLFLSAVQAGHAGTRVMPIATVLGSLDAKNGVVSLNERPLESPKGARNEAIDLFFLDMNASDGVKKLEDKIFLFSYVSKRGSKPFTEGFIILDLTSGNPHFSNPIELPESYSWGDNHYAVYKDGVVYFGVYQSESYEEKKTGSPNPRQFIYQNRRLEENLGYWAGPKKPRKYIEPDSRGPCFNVANVPECLAEIERDKARKNQRRNNVP
jgi:hypothetical protein